MRQEHVETYDDLDGTMLGPEAERIAFRLGQSCYEIDLSPAHAEQMREVWSTYTRAARPIPVPEPQDKPPPARVRAWAAENGLKVRPQGRISGEIYRAYRQAHDPRRDPDDRT